jgi:hypothetical protein
MPPVAFCPFLGARINAKYRLQLGTKVSHYLWNWAA